MIGNAPSIKALRAEIVDLSTTDVNVMLLGETGTGKELVAKALHDLGHRSAEPFIPINCAAVPVARFEESVVRHCRQRPGIAGASRGGHAFP
jgi:two-component system C4-dicarboxylate transport response regulator DctD